MLLRVDEDSDYDLSERWVLKQVATLNMHKADVLKRRCQRVFSFLFVFEVEYSYGSARKEKESENRICLVLPQPVSVEPAGES